MKSRDFCYWLQGYFEITSTGLNYGEPSLHKDQVELIRKHLNMVFIHEIDPSFPAKQQNDLNAAHTTTAIPRC